MFKQLAKHSLYIGLAIAVLGFIGSLYFSEIKGLLPCLLCWYQRIALYPLVAIFAVGIATRSKEAWLYAAPFVFIGFLIAIYHNLLVYGILPEGAATCTVGVPCAKVTWTMWGFLTIPLLSLLAFASLTALYFIHKKFKSHGWFSS